MPRAIYCADGRVRVIHFATDDPALIARDTNALLAEEPGATWADVSELPNRRFRAAWTKGGAANVIVDVAKARDIRVTEIRAERDIVLAATDGVLLRDQEQGKDTRDLLTKRQALRDAPQQAVTDLAILRTPDEIAAYTPEVLK